jgi:hypothetical protein
MPGVIDSLKILDLESSACFKRITISNLCLTHLAGWQYG